MGYSRGLGLSYFCDSEADRQTDWEQFCHVFCLAEKTNYILVGSEWVNMGKGISYADLMGDIYHNSITPSPFASPANANINNYNPDGIVSADVLRLSTVSTSKTITGIIAPTSNKSLLILNTNLSSNNIILSGSDLNSLPNNRFLHSGNITVQRGRSVSLYYDTIIARWSVATF